MEPSGSNRGADPLGAFVSGQGRDAVAAEDGPLRGLSFAVKDLIDVAGLPTGGGNPDWARAHPVPDRHAPVVEALLAAGAKCVGKTVTDEVSLGILGENPHDGTPVNPRAPDRVPGGSSSGSASAVAGGACDFALGTDTGGSVRVPASFSGLYGIRPTHGRLPFGGIVVQAPSSDTVGWLARDAVTFARVGEVLLGEAVPDALPTRLVLATDAFDCADADVQAALRPAVARLTGLVSAVTEELLAPAGLAAWQLAQRVLQSGEAYRTLQPWLDACNPRLAWSVALQLARAAAYTEFERGRAELLRQEARGRLSRLLPPGTVVCLPTTPFPAPKRGLSVSALSVPRDRIACLTSPAGLTGVPQVNLPWSMPDGTPIGLSVIGARDSDRELLALARAFGAALAK